MIRRRAALDTTNPPGQVRTLGDYIRQLESRDKALEALEAGTPATPSKQELLGALEGLEGRIDWDAVYDDGDLKECEGFSALLKKFIEEKA
jgi:hypothetical protein